MIIVITYILINLNFRVCLDDKDVENCLRTISSK